MARIVLAQGTSHSPQLSIDPQQWDVFLERDRDANLLQDSTGRRYTFDELVEIRGDELAPAIGMDVWQRQKETCDAAIAELRAQMAAADPDVVVIIGDDQQELFDTDNLPALAIYRGATVLCSGVDSPDKIERVEGNPVRAMSEWAYSPPADVQWPVAVDMADHLLVELTQIGFDFAQSDRPPRPRGVGHAWGFPFQRVFDRARAAVPVMINTYYPPNQPTAQRCLELGEALRSAIEAFPADITVGVMASGGLSHHLIDEALDRVVLDAISTSDLDALAAIPGAALEGGTSEIRNWIAMAPSAAGLSETTLVYEPCYRSLAGTGCAMAFGSWS